MDDLLRDAAARAIRYRQEVANRPVWPTPAALDALGRLDEALPPTRQNDAAVLALLDDMASPATVATSGGRYFGFVVGSSLPATLAANWLAGAWDQNAGGYIQSPAASRLEDVATKWVLDVLGLPDGCGAGFVTCATIANFSALAAARHALFARKGWDVEKQGLFGAPPITVVVGEEVHVSVLKALGLLGLGRDRVVRVPVDDQGRMRADALPPLDDHTIVCLQAGNVNTGAFGLWANAAPARSHLLAGYGGADSWATDAHKWLNVPYDSGIVFVRDAQHLRGAMSTSAPYLVRGERRDPFDYTPEFSRRARGVEVWAALRSLGREGLADLIERSCRHASRFADGLRRAGCAILNEVVINQVLVSFGNPERTRQVIAAIQADGTCWVGGTVWQGHTAMRISVSSWATTEEDVERSLAAMVRLGEVAKS